MIPLHPPVVRGNQFRVSQVCPAKFLSSEFNTTYMENVRLYFFFLFLLNEGLPTPLVFDLNACQRVVMALNSCICLRVCMFACAGECVSMCVCLRALSLCPGMPFLHRPHTIQHSTRGPGAMCKWGVSRRENDNTVSNAAYVDSDRKRRGEIERVRDCCHIETLASYLDRPVNERVLMAQQQWKIQFKNKKKGVFRLQLL